MPSVTAHPARTVGASSAQVVSLLTVAHGTRSAPGNDVARSLTAAAGRELGVEARCSFVELAEPLLTEAVTTARPGTVVVPLLLSTGIHLRQDLPQMSDQAPSPVLLGRSLGPHAELAAAQVDRLRESGATPGSPLVMVAAGSSDALATRDLVRAAELLAVAWGAPVRLATMTALGERPAAVVNPGDAVSPYLLSPGYFASRLRQVALEAGAARVAEVIGTHPRVVALVVRRARALAQARRPDAITRGRARASRECADAPGTVACEPGPAVRSSD